MEQNIVRFRDAEQSGPKTTNALQSDISAFKQID